MDLPYALGCPSCKHFVITSEEDPDATLSDLHEHIHIKHAGYDFAKTQQLLAKVRDIKTPEDAR